MPAPPIPEPLSDAVLDDEVIMECLGAQNIERDIVDELDISFRRIKCIENLVCFDKLLVLRLSNNRISVIENIAHLKSIQILDLSFNDVLSADTMELKSLSSLCELNMFSNKLSDLGVLPELSSLVVLNVGSNDIAELEKFLPLRKLGRLQALTAKDNPCSKDGKADEYNSFILSYLGKCLRYFDYRVVDDENVQACREQFQNELESLEATELAQAKEAKRLQSKEEAHNRLRKIYMLEAATL